MPFSQPEEDGCGSSGGTYFPGFELQFPESRQIVKKAGISAEADGFLSRRTRSQGSSSVKSGRI